jgi:hypothetical protein
MAAELYQREKILAFCERFGIAAPSFTSTLDLTRCVASALAVLDGGPAGGGGRVDRLAAQRDALRAELSAAVVEGAALELELGLSHDSAAAVEALALLARIEAIADAALPRPVVA